MSEPHRTFGACLKAKNIRVAFCQSASGKDYTKSKAWTAELDAYESAVRQGMQPEGTTWKHVRHAEKLSEGTGLGYGTEAFDQKLNDKMLERANV